MSDVNTDVEPAPKREKTQKCTKCFQRYPRSDFGSNSTSSTGRQSYCRQCRNGVHVERRKHDIEHRLRHYFHTRMVGQLESVGGAPADLYANMETYLGYTFKSLKRHLDKEVMEREGISLREAIKRGYHIDHVKPLSLFKPSSALDVVFRECWAETNLSAISSGENLAKGARFDEEIDIEALPAAE